jgi:hypothetical protein
MGVTRAGLCFILSADLCRTIALFEKLFVNVNHVPIRPLNPPFWGTSGERYSIDLWLEAPQIGGVGGKCKALSCVYKHTLKHPGQCPNLATSAPMPLPVAPPAPPVAPLLLPVAKLPPIAAFPALPLLPGSELAHQKP